MVCGDYKECFYNLEKCSHTKLKKKRSKAGFKIAYTVWPQLNEHLSVLFRLNFWKLYQNSDSDHSGWWEYKQFLKILCIFHVFYNRYVLAFARPGSEPKVKTEAKGTILLRTPAAAKGCPSIGRLPLTALSWGSWFWWAAGRYVWRAWAVGVCSRKEKS